MQVYPPIYLHLIFAILQFEISSLKNLIFSLFQLEFTGYSRQKNPVQTRKKIQFIKLENCKNQVQIVWTCDRDIKKNENDSIFWSLEIVEGGTFVTLLCDVANERKEMFWAFKPRSTEEGV